MFHIGVLASGWGSAAEMLGRISARSAGRLGPCQRPELTLSCAPLGTASDPWQRGDPEANRAQLVLSSGRLRHAGAHFFVCPDDATYVPLGSSDADLALPGLHVAPVIAAAAHRKGFARVAILGTRWTLDRRSYADALDPMGITAAALPLRDEATLHSIIFDELVHGRCSLRSRDAVLEMIEAMHLEGAQAVVLGCPELASAVSPANSPLPLLDAAALLAGAALDVAVGDAPLPTWRGGPHANGPTVTASREQHSVT